MINNADIVTENKERKNMHPDRSGNTSRYGINDMQE